MSLAQTAQHLTLLAQLRQARRFLLWDFAAGSRSAKRRISVPPHGRTNYHEALAALGQDFAYDVGGLARRRQAIAIELSPGDAERYRGVLPNVEIFVDAGLPDLRLEASNGHAGPVVAAPEITESRTVVLPAQLWEALDARGDFNEIIKRFVDGL